MEADDIERLYRSHFAPMMRVAFAMTGSNDVAEDVVHDAFVRCAGRLDRVDNPTAYLRAAVVNACRSYHRRASVARRLTPPVELPTENMAVEVVELADALSALGGRQRAAIVLRYLCDLDDGEIAEILGCRPATVRSLLHRGLAQLREAVT